MFSSYSLDRAALDYHLVWMLTSSLQGDLIDNHVGLTENVTVRVKNR